MTEKQSLFEDIAYHLLNDEKPSSYLSSLLENEMFCKQYPFTMISGLKGIAQTPVHHPEGDVWNHTLLVVDEAAKRKRASKNQAVFMWTALLHDIGKKDTTKIRKGKITSYDHDKLGAKLAEDFLREFCRDVEFISLVSHMVRWHMQILFAVKNSAFSQLEEMNRQVSFKEIALFGLCDRLGRGRADEKKERENVRVFIEKCQSIDKCS